MSHRLFPRVFGGAPRHELHHQHGNVYFHQFFMWLDDLAGFTLPAEQRPHEAPPTGADADAEDDAPDEAEERLLAAMPFRVHAADPAPRDPAATNAEL